MHLIMWVWSWTNLHVQKQPLLLVGALSAQIQGRWRHSPSQRLPRAVVGETFAEKLKNDLEDKVSANVQDKGNKNYLVIYTIPGSAKRV